MFQIVLSCIIVILDVHRYAFWPRLTFADCKVLTKFYVTPDKAAYGLGDIDLDHCSIDQADKMGCILSQTSVLEVATANIVLWFIEGIFRGQNSSWL